MRLEGRTPYKKALVIAFILFFLALWPAFTAELSVPRLEMASRGWVNDGDFVLSSVLSADLALSGGYKYSFLLGFSLEAPDLGQAIMYRNFSFSQLPPATPVDSDDYNDLVDQINNRLNNQAVLGFRIARATIRNLFSLPLEISYFVGSGDDFCAGDEFVSRFGLSSFGTEFRGFYYFPEGIGGNMSRRYNGIHGVRGTGFSFALTKWDKIVPMLYLYQNFPSDFIDPANIFGGNLYSGDLRLLFHHDWLRLEAFGGFSLNTDFDASIRAGIMAHLVGPGVEFFFQGGFPGWKVGEKFSIDNMFFLIEPRLTLGIFNMHLTFFYHPVEYIHVVTPDEKGKANINVKFLFGNLNSGIAGGIETGGELKIDGSEGFDFHISPMGTFISSGLRWDAKIRIKPLKYDTPEEMVDFFIGVRTAL